jgi:hypothetical protein
MCSAATKPRKAPLQAHGEYIPLNWDGTPDNEYVRGHVTAIEFAAAFNQEHWGDDPYQAPTPEAVTHEWGRWSQEVGPDGSGRVLRTYSEPGRGRFPITSAPHAPFYPPQHWVESRDEWCRRLGHRREWQDGGPRCATCATNQPKVSS